MIAMLIASLSNSRFTSVPHEVGKLWLTTVPLHPKRTSDLVSRILLWSRLGRIATLVVPSTLFFFIKKRLSHDLFFETTSVTTSFNRKGVSLICIVLLDIIYV